MNKRKVLLYTVRGGAPTPPTPADGHRVLYLQNGDNSSNSKLRNWSIDTGITWRDVFVNASTLGLDYPGLETEVVYSYTWTPPEGGVFAGCNPRYNQEGGGGSRDQGGFWRLFGHGGAHFCFDCPSEDDRATVAGSMVSGRIYTETGKYGYIDPEDLSSLKTYLKVDGLGEVLRTNSYSWTQANLPHNIYLWADNSQTTGDTAPRGGVRIYSFTAYYLEAGVRHTKVYEGVPWVDNNNVACIKDLVSGQLQYNCATNNPQPFLYAEIQ